MTLYKNRAIDSTRGSLSKRELPTGVRDSDGNFWALMDLARRACSAQGSMSTHGPTQLSHPAPQTDSLDLGLDLDLSLPCNHPLQHFFEKLLFPCSQNDTFCNVYSRGIKSSMDLIELFPVSRNAGSGKGPGEKMENRRRLASLPSLAESQQVRMSLFSKNF